MTQEHLPFKEILQPIGIGEKAGRMWYDIPSLPNKMVRAFTGTYSSVEEALSNIHYQKKELELIKERYGIQYVDYQVILGNCEQGWLTTYAVVDKLSDAIGFDKIIEHEIPAQYTAEVGEEFDLVTSRLTFHLKDTALNGGVLARELPRLDQFAYVPSRLRGERCVFVDVDPMYSYALQKFEGGPCDRQSCAIITDSLLELVLQTIQLEQKLNRTSLAREDLRALLEVMPDNTASAVTRIKGDIARALETNDLSELIAADQENEEDEAESGYWYRFMNQAGLPRAVETFPDDESIQRHINRLGE